MVQKLVWYINPQTRFWSSITFAAYIVHSNNDHHIRLRALHNLSKEQYKQGVISGDIAGYIMEGAYYNFAKALWSC